MTTDDEGRTGPADRFDRATDILKSYPDINAEELEELKQWFRKASAFDVASMASNEACAENYVAFRTQYIDPFSWKDLLIGIGGIAIVLAVVAGIGLLAR